VQGLESTRPTELLCVPGRSRRRGDDQLRTSSRASDGKSKPRATSRHAQKSRSLGAFRHSWGRDEGSRNSSRGKLCRSAGEQSAASRSTIIDRAEAKLRSSKRGAARMHPVTQPCREGPSAHRHQGGSARSVPDAALQLRAPTHRNVVFGIMPSLLRLVRFLIGLLLPLDQEVETLLWTCLAA
jgi:hypothetical protein